MPIDKVPARPTEAPGPDRAVTLPPPEPDGPVTCGLLPLVVRIGGRLFVDDRSCLHFYPSPAAETEAPAEAPA
jgi:hypothetical protein